MQTILDFVITNWSEIGVAITGLYTAAAVVVRLTPTPADDAILAKVHSVLTTILGVVKK